MYHGFCSICCIFLYYCSLVLLCYRLLTVVQTTPSLDPTPICGALACTTIIPDSFHSQTQTFSFLFSQYSFSVSSSLLFHFQLYHALFSTAILLSIHSIQFQFQIQLPVASRPNPIPCNAPKSHCYTISCYPAIHTIILSMIPCRRQYKYGTIANSTIPTPSPIILPIPIPTTRPIQLPGAKVQT